MATYPEKLSGSERYIVKDINGDVIKRFQKLDSAVRCADEYDAQGASVWYNETAIYPSDDFGTTETVPDESGEEAPAAESPDEESTDSSCETCSWIGIGRINVNLNLRAEASLNAEIIGMLRRGSNVTVHAERNGWLKVSQDGKVGWCDNTPKTRVTVTLN